MNEEGKRENKGEGKRERKGVENEGKMMGTMTMTEANERKEREGGGKGELDESSENKGNRKINGVES